MKEIDKTSNFFTEEIRQNELIRKKQRKICKILNYTEHLLILSFTVTGCVSISAFASLVGILVDITSSATIKISAITAGIKKYQSIIKKKKKKTW